MNIILRSYYYIRGSKKAIGLHLIFVNQKQLVRNKRHVNVTTQYVIKVRTMSAIEFIWWLTVYCLVTT